MGGGAAAPEVIVIHAGQIVMHQQNRCASTSMALPTRKGMLVIHPEQPGRNEAPEKASAACPPCEGGGEVAHPLPAPGLADRGAAAAQLSSTASTALAEAANGRAGQASRRPGAGASAILVSIGLSSSLGLAYGWNDPPNPAQTPGTGPVSQPFASPGPSRQRLFGAESPAPPPFRQISHRGTLPGGLALPAKGLNGVSRCGKCQLLRCGSPNSCWP